MLSGMELYLGNLPTRTTPQDLRGFLQDAFDRNASRRLVQAVFRDFNFERDARIHVVEQRHRTGTYRYGHIFFHDPRIARFFVEEGNGQRLAGQKLEVREFVPRKNFAERRDARDIVVAWSGAERRQQQRRAVNGAWSASKRVSPR